MLVLAKSSLVNASTDSHPSSQSVGSQAPEKSKTGLSEDDLLHEELRRHYPVPKNLDEVEKQALTFHVVRLNQREDLAFEFWSTLLRCATLSSDSCLPTETSWRVETTPTTTQSTERYFFTFLKGRQANSFSGELATVCHLGAFNLDWAGFLSNSN